MNVFIKIKAGAVLAAFAMTALMSAPAAAMHPNGVRTAHLQKTTAKRFKRGVRRTGKKIRHFIHRASGKH